MNGRSLPCCCNVKCGYWLESNVFVVCIMWSVVRESNFLTSLGLVKFHHSIRSIYRERNTTPKTDSHFDSFSRPHLYPSQAGPRRCLVETYVLYKMMQILLKTGFTTNQFHSVWVNSKTGLLGSCLRKFLQIGMENTRGKRMGSKDAVLTVCNGIF